jgi:lysophospholipase L1-like esterase
MDPVSTTTPGGAVEEPMTAPPDVDATDAQPDANGQIGGDVGTEVELEGTGGAPQAEPSTPEDAGVELVPEEPAPVDAATDTTSTVSAADGEPEAEAGTAVVEVDPSLLPAVTLHLAGDSTVMTYQAGSAQEGWGQELGQFFIDKVTINNQAIGGASIRTFQTGRWPGIVSSLKAGDFVMIQFGANDSGTVAGRHVEPDDFAVALNEMVDDVESKQATAIFVTPSALQEWSGGVQGNARLGPYADAMREVGPLRDVLVDDLNARSVDFLNEIGQTAAQEIYLDGDKAHFTQMGAIQMAQFVAEELQRIQSPLGNYVAQ